MSAEIWTKVKNFVGLNADEEYEEGEEETLAAEPVRNGKASRNIVGLPTAPSSEVVVLEPRSFEDALGIIEHLRSRRALILNLQDLLPEQSQRLVDFVSGACHALDGHQERIGESIFLFTPSNFKINSLATEGAAGAAWMPTAQPTGAVPNKELFWRVR